MPHIYTPEEVQRLLRATAQLTPAGSIRPITYVTLLSLLFATGLRISEALALQVEDITPEGLVVRLTKFRKSRLVPLHPTAREGIEGYLAVWNYTSAHGRRPRRSRPGTVVGREGPTPRRCLRALHRAPWSRLARRVSAIVKAIEVQLESTQTATPVVRLLIDSGAALFGQA
jgi:integrase